MLKAFIKFGLLTLFSQTDACYANGFASQTGDYTRDFWKKGRTIHSTLHSAPMDYQKHAVTTQSPMYTRATSGCSFQDATMLAMQGGVMKECAYLSNHSNAAVEALWSPLRAGPNGSDAAPFDFDWEPANLQSNGVPQTHLTSAEIEHLEVAWVYSVVSATLLTIVILQWLLLWRWHSRNQQQSQALVSVRKQLDYQYVQLETNIALANALHQQIQQQQSQRKSLLKSLCDDIANPIAVIQTSFTGWLKMSRLNDVMLEKARLIEKSAERIERCVNQAKCSIDPDINLQQCHYSELSPVLSRLSPIVDYSLQYGSPATRHGNDNVNIAHDEKPNLVVYGDEVAIEFVLANIVNEVTTLAAKKQKVTICVKDNVERVIIDFNAHHEGLSPKRMNQHTLLSEPHRSLLRNVAAQCGIEIQRNAPTVPHGIRLTLRRYQPPVSNKAAVNDHFAFPVVFEPCQQPVLQQPGPSPDSPKCLVIERDPEMQVCIIQALKGYFSCKGIFDDTIALQQVTDWQPDLIITELQSEVYDGFELIRALKQRVEQPSPPLLILTNKGTTENRLKALDLNIDCLMEKPFSEELLLKSAVKISEQHQQHKHGDEIREHVQFQLSKDAIFLAQLNSLVEKHIANAEFTFEDYFSQFALSKRQFFRRVNTLTRCTPKQYLIQKRLELAQHLMSKGILLDAVTKRCGFKDQQSLIKVYEAHFGEAVF